MKLEDVPIEWWLMLEGAIMTDELKCADCKKPLGKIKATCPSCKDTRCFKCWTKHLDDQVCSYGNAKEIPVL